MVDREQLPVESSSHPEMRLNYAPTVTQHWNLKWKVLAAMQEGVGHPEASVDLRGHAIHHHLAPSLSVALQLVSIECTYSCNPLKSTDIWDKAHLFIVTG